MKKYAALLLTLLLTGVTDAQTTSRDLVSYQGLLTDSTGALLGVAAPVQRSVKFRLYNMVSGGTLLWSEQQDVTFFKGNFSVSLGSGTKISTDTPSNQTLPATFGLDNNYYLEITVVNPAVSANAAPTETLISPRQRILSTPLALRATVADSVISTTTSKLGTAEVNGALRLIGANSLEFGSSNFKPSIKYESDTIGLRIKGGSSTANSDKIFMDAVGGVKFNAKLDITSDSAGNSFRGAKLLLHGGENYSLGVQNNSLYFRSADEFAFYKGGGYTVNVNGPGTNGTELVRFTATNAQFPKEILLRDGSNSASFSFAGSKVTLNRDLQVTGALTANSLSLTNESSEVAANYFRCSSTLGEKIALHGGGNPYAIGTQGATVYFRTNGNINFYSGGTHAESGPGYEAGSTSEYGKTMLEANNSEFKIYPPVNIEKTINFGSRNGQLINLYSTTYCLGIQNETAYLRTAKNFNVYEDGAHNDVENSAGAGGVKLLSLNSTSLTTKGELRFNEDTTNPMSPSYYYLRANETGGGFTIGNFKEGRYASFNGDSGWNYNSDARLKKNIVNAEPILDRLLNVRMVRYQWKTQKDNDVKNHFGVIAQELQPLFPDFVTDTDRRGDDPLPYKVVAIPNFGLLATAALQEFHKAQAQENQNLRAQNANLEDRVAKLEAAVKALLAR